MTYTQEQLREIIDNHGLWLKGNSSGVRANLTRADLTGANLYSANLTGASLYSADLTGANLTGADLTGANLTGAVHSWAQIAFLGHGECGRMLTAIILKKGNEATYFCGCFTGSAQELRAYIEQGEERLKASRTRAMEIVDELLKMPKP